MIEPAERRAKRYHDAFREHWGVFVDGHLVDASLDERDVEYRSCSLCECHDSLVIVRHCEPYMTSLADIVTFVAGYGAPIIGPKRWRINDFRVWPVDPSQLQPPAPHTGDAWPWSSFGGCD